ncbi:MAG: Mrp/NBP35 family ATP-binding protein [Dehalococcoidia bacterium]|nr:Mrp/NBP35 family ATP-binding protein [Dehalococcoidia bacterium]
MATEEQVWGSLDGVLVPGAMRSITKMNLVRGVAVSDHKVKVSLASTALYAGAKDWLKSKVEEVIKGLSGTNQVETEFVEAKPAEVNEIKHVVAVMSGKGGVGKSLVSSLLALSLARQDLDAGILDGDITGPSIPKMFGMTVRPTGSDSGIMPVSTKTGIEMMSINLFLPHEDDAVIWRGPLIGKAITQFWEEVLWGKLDYLIVDLPPGTADAPLTVLQSLPVSGVVIVFSPQELAAMVVRKAVQMCQQMRIPIIGVVENMSYLVLPDSGKRLEIFGKSKGEEMAKAADAPLLGQLPIDPELARLCDDGGLELYNSPLVTDLGRAFVKAASERGRKDPKPLYPGTREK